MVIDTPAKENGYFSANQEDNSRTVNKVVKSEIGKWPSFYCDYYFVFKFQIISKKVIQVIK